MERPAKRLRVGGTSRLAAAENEDELVLRPEEVNRRRDPGYQAQMRTAWLKSRFESIFEKYGNPDLGSDEIDLRTGEVVTDNGHIQTMGNRIVEDAVEALADDQDALIIRGNGPKPPRNSSFLGIVPGISQAKRLLPAGPTPLVSPASISLDPFGPRDPKWQVPELPKLSVGNGLDDFLAHMPTRRVALKRPLALQNGDQADVDEEDDVLLGLSAKTQNITPKYGARSAVSTPHNTTLLQQQSPESNEQKKRASLAKKRKESTARTGKKLQTKVTTTREQPPQTVDGPTHYRDPESKAEDEPTRRRELVAIKSTKGQKKEPPSVFNKPTNQTLRVELSNNIASKDEYQILTLDDTLPQTEMATGESEQHGKLWRDDTAPASDELNASEATRLEQNEDKSPAHLSRPAKEAVPSYPEASSPNNVADRDISVGHKPVKSRKLKGATSIANSSDSYLRNVVDPAYAFSDEDESSILLPKSQKHQEQSAIQGKKRSRPSARKSKSGTKVDPLRSSSANSLSLAVPGRESQAHTGNSDKENAPLVRTSGVKVKQTRKRKAPSTTDTADDHSPPLLMTDDVAPNSPEIQESPEAQIYLEEAIAQEPNLVTDKGLVIISVHTSDAYPASIGPAGLVSSLSPVVRTNKTPAAGSAATALDLQSSTKRIAEKRAAEEADTTVSMVPPQSLETPLLPLQEKSSAQNKTPIIAPAEALEQPGMSSPTCQTRSVRRTYSNRNKKTHHLPVTPLQKQPPKVRNSAVTSNDKHPASGPASNKRPPSSTKTSLLSLISSDDEDELSLGPEAFTPSSRRGVLNTSAILAPSPSAIRRSTLKMSLAGGSHSKQRTPQRRSRGFHPYSSPTRGSPSKQGGPGSARGAGAGSSCTPRGTPMRRMIGPEPSGELFPTPGGTMRRCGEAGFRCDRDFCLTCE